MVISARMKILMISASARNNGEIVALMYPECVDLIVSIFGVLYMYEFQTYHYTVLVAATIDHVVCLFYSLLICDMFHII